MRFSLAVFLLGLGFAVLACADQRPPAAELAPVVEMEEDVYTYTNADNGAGPMWCDGSTCLVRSGDHVFASGLRNDPRRQAAEQLPLDAFRRGANGWDRVQADPDGRTREPSPLVAFSDGRVFLSVNPTLDKPKPPRRPGATRRAAIRAIDPKAPPVSLSPVWQGKPAFTEHSYRSFAADGAAGELILFQNIGYTHAEWTFRDRAGKWSAQGQLKWPWGAEYDKPEPIRVCYPNVALRDRAVHFCRGQRRRRALPGLARVQARADRPRVGLRFPAAVLHLDARHHQGAVSPTGSRSRAATRPAAGSLRATSGSRRTATCICCWSERAIDERLRAKFFPDAKQSDALNYAVVRGGKVIRRSSILSMPVSAGLSGRFHVTPDNRLFVVCQAPATDPNHRHASENRLVEILPDGALGSPLRIPFQKPFHSFFTTTVPRRFSAVVDAGDAWPVRRRCQYHKLRTREPAAPLNAAGSNHHPLRPPAADKQCNKPASRPERQTAPSWPINRGHRRSLIQPRPAL